MPPVCFYIDNYENDNFFNSLEDFLETPKNMTITPSMRGYSSLGDTESIFDTFAEGALASINRLSEISSNIENMVEEEDDLMHGEQQIISIGSVNAGGKKRIKSVTNNGSAVAVMKKHVKTSKPKPPPVPTKSITSDEAARLRDTFTKQLKEQERKRLEGA